MFLVFISFFPLRTLHFFLPFLFPFLFPSKEQKIRFIFKLFSLTLHLPLPSLNFFLSFFLYIYFFLTHSCNSYFFFSSILCFSFLTSFPSYLSFHLSCSTIHFLLPFRFQFSRLSFFPTQIFISYFSSLLFISFFIRYILIQFSFLYLSLHFDFLSLFFPSFFIFINFRDIFYSFIFLFRSFIFH